MAKKKKKEEVKEEVNEEINEELKKEELKKEKIKKETKKTEQENEKTEETTDKKEFSRERIEAIQHYIYKQVTNVVFGILSPKLIKKMASVKIVTPELYDLSLIHI